MLQKKTENLTYIHKEAWELTLNLELSFGEVIGTISADNIPLMFKKLGHEIEENNLTFDKWIVSNESRFIEIVKEFSICNV